jgi:hypothetical protein
MKISVDKLKNFTALVRELATGLKRLDFDNNFESFETSDLTIAANTEEKIRNELDPAIPTKMVIVKQTGNGLVTAGDTAWTSNYVYIKNNDASNSVTVRVIFFK